MSKTPSFFTNFRQIKFAGLTNAITAVNVSDSFGPTLEGFPYPSNYPSFPDVVRVLVALQGATTKQDVQISIGITDGTGTEGWSAPQVAEIRALPDEAGTKVASILTFSTRNATSLRIAMETALDGDGAKFYVSFGDK
jgi:hypothetical protein